MDPTTARPRPRGEPEEWLDVEDIGRYLRLPLEGRTTRVCQFHDREIHPLPYVMRAGKQGHRHRLTKKDWIDEWLIRDFPENGLWSEYLATPQAAIWTACSQLWEDLCEISFHARAAGVKWSDLPPIPPEEAAEIRLRVLSAIRAAVMVRFEEMECDPGIKALAYEIDVRYRSETRHARAHETRTKR